MTPVEPSPAPPRKRHLLSGGWRFGALLLVSISFGLINSWGEKWPLWALYVPKFAITLAVGFALGIAQEQPFSENREWDNLRWRMVVFQAVRWSVTFVLFLSGLDAWERQGGWQTYFVVGALLLACSSLVERLVSRFRCPHCGQFFFQAKPSKNEEEGGFLTFGVSHWRNTRCQHCGWPLWKPLDSKSPAGT